MWKKLRCINGNRLSRCTAQIVWLASTFVHVVDVFFVIQFPHNILPSRGFRGFRDFRDFRDFRGFRNLRSFRPLNSQALNSSFQVLLPMPAARKFTYSALNPSYPARAAQTPSAMETESSQSIGLQWQSLTVAYKAVTGKHTSVYA